MNKDDVKTNTMCIKVDNLRKVYKDKDMDLRKWLENPNNVYVGRKGRIFIDGEIFHYKGSKWGNPYTLKEYDLDQSLKLYKKHIIESGLIDEIEKLRGKTLGCFCVQKENSCHAQILVDLLENKNNDEKDNGKKSEIKNEIKSEGKIKRISESKPSIRIFGYKKNLAGQRVSYPKVKGWINIPAWSRGADPWKQLSPFELGPFKFEDTDIDGNIIETKAYVFENFYQSFKVWNTTTKQSQTNWKWPSEIHIDEDGNPNKNWYKWHKALLKTKEPIRFPNGTVAKNGPPEYAWWKGERLDVIDGRKKIYIPFLQKLYREHSVYQDLLKMVREGKQVIIIEPDGPPPDLYPEGMDVTLELLIELQDITQIGKIQNLPENELTRKELNTYQPYGHGMVIALTLLEDLK